MRRNHLSRNRAALWLSLIGLLGALHPLSAGDTIEEFEGRGLEIRSEPAGARVYVDGIERGLTPLVLGLPAGEYNIRLHKDDLLGVRYVDRRFKVTVNDSSRLVVSVDLETAKGQVLLGIRRSPGSPGEEQLPLNPAVTVGGETLTGSLLSLPAGYRTIVIRAFGWEDVASTVYVEEGAVHHLDVELKPAPFTLTGATVRRAKFNPGNSGSLGSAEFGFTVSGPGRGRITIENAGGEPVFSAPLGPFTGWVQSAAWNGRSSGGAELPDGAYTVVIDAESVPWDGSEPVRQRAALQVVIDSSIHIQPLSLSSGKGGLLFAPLPEVIPSRSFQIDGTLLFGRAPVTEKPWDSLPFAAAFRFSFLDQIEVASSLNVLPRFSAGLDAGVAASVKWLFLRLDPLFMAGGVSYGWAEKMSVTPFGLGAGAELFLPLGWRFLPGFFLTLTPGLIWTGEQGYPSEAAPRALLSGGILFRYSFVAAGISLRSEFGFAGTAKGAGPVMLGGEVRLFPPPSSLVFTLLGGYWQDGSQRGGFGGAGVGFIY
jgi:hypothetical protein